jgi:hypothetical protein
MFLLREPRESYPTWNQTGVGQEDFQERGYSHEITGLAICLVDATRNVRDLWLSADAACCNRGGSITVGRLGTIHIGCGYGPRHGQRDYFE